MAKKHLGQNFLFDPSILTRILQVSDVDSSDLVVEIGAGHGRLTDLLVKRVKELVAIEIDEYFAKNLEERYRGNNNIRVIHADAMRFPYEELGEFKVVANIPYYITTPLLFRLLKARGRLKSMTITMQREVAERIVADNEKGDYGLLSVAVQYYGNAQIKFIIPKGAFRPTPKVDSAVIKIDVLPKPTVDVGDERLFFKILRAGFGQRRKTLFNTLKNLNPDIKDILSRIGIDYMRRAETLSIEEFSKISREMSSYK